MRHRPRWYDTAVEFLTDCDGRLAKVGDSGTLEPASCLQMAHTLKNTAEMLGMQGVSNAAYEMEKGAATGADELGAPQRPRRACCPLFPPASHSPHTGYSAVPRATQR